MCKVIASTHTRYIECQSFDEAWDELNRLLYLNEKEKINHEKQFIKNGFVVVGYGFTLGQITLKE